MFFCDLGAGEERNELTLPSEDKWGTRVLALLQLNLLLFMMGSQECNLQQMASRVLGQGIVLDKVGAGFNVIMSNVIVCIVGNW